MWIQHWHAHFWVFKTISFFPQKSSQSLHCAKLTNFFHLSIEIVMAAHNIACKISLKFLNLRLSQWEMTFQAVQLVLIEIMACNCVTAVVTVLCFEILDRCPIFLSILHFFCHASNMHQMIQNSWATQLKLPCEFWVH